MIFENTIVVSPIPDNILNWLLVALVVVTLIAVVFTGLTLR
jgi:hypothetical protein